MEVLASTIDIVNVYMGGQESRVVVVCDNEILSFVLLISFLFEVNVRDLQI